MKQHITSKQLNELSKVGLEKLAQYCKDKSWGPSCLMSIGQMIEFLGDKLLDISAPWEHAKKGYRNHWSVGLLNESKIAGKDFNQKELADALWEACKEILNG